MLLLLLLAACTGPGKGSPSLDTDGDDTSSPDTACTDCDEDGYAVGEDCDDASADVHPDASEVLNGIDDDCDGQVDLDVPISSALLSVSGADDSLGRSVARAGDLDGDGTADVWIGATAANSGATAAVGCVAWFSGAGRGALALGDAGGMVCGEDQRDYLGNAVVGGVDLDVDGEEDVAIAASRTDAGGSVYVLGGAVAGAVDAGSARTTLETDGVTEGFGDALAAGDVTGDGLPDIAVGEPDTFEGRIYVYAAPIGSGTLDGADAAVRIDGPFDGSGAGVGLATGDLDGDGVADLLVGASDGDDGVVYLLVGPLSGSIALSPDDLWFESDERGDGTGAAIAVGGDVDGDGYGDGLVGAGEAGGDSNGRAWLLVGGTTAPGGPAGARTTFTTSEAHGTMGASVAFVRAGTSVGVALGDPTRDADDGVVGGVYLFASPAAGTLDALVDSTASLVGQGGEFPGGALALVGDVDGDGGDDLLVGGDTSGAGGAWLFGLGWR